MANAAGVLYVTATYRKPTLRGLEFTTPRAAHLHISALCG
jgi:hypothetical protein